MRRSTVVVLTAVLLSSGGCSWFVSRREVTEMNTRIGRISTLLKRRRTEEKLLGEEITKARRELAKIMRARERYRKAQTTFIQKVRSDMALLRERLGTLHSGLERLAKSVDGDLKRAVLETKAVLKARTQELVGLETTLSQLAAFSLRERPQGLLRIVQALADAKEWKLLHGYLGAFLLKHPTSPSLQEALYYAAKKLAAAGEIKKTLLYSTLSMRTFPKGKYLPELLQLAGETYYKISDCTKALFYLERFLAAHKTHKGHKKVEQTVKSIKAQRHSRQYCAQ